MDITTGEPLFSSKDKFESGYGWPVLLNRLPQKSLNIKKDNSFNMTRIEVLSRSGHAHLKAMCLMMVRVIKVVYVIASTVHQLSLFH